MPARINSDAAPASTPAVTTRILLEKPRCFAKRRNSRPSRSPRSKSRSTKSIGLRRSTSRASSMVPQCAATSNPGSTLSSRLTLSRNKAWSSSSKMRTVFSTASGMRRFLCCSQAQGGREAASLGSRLVRKVAPKAAHDDARNVESQAARLGTGLERLKEFFGGSDAHSRILESNYNFSVLLLRQDPKSLGFARHHRPLAILGQVQKHLNQTVPVGPDQRQRLPQIPFDVDFRFVISGFDQDSQLLENGRQLNHLSVLRRGTQLQSRYPFQTLNQTAQGSKIFVGFKFGDAREVLVNDQDGSAEVANLMGDGTHQDPGVLQQMVEAEVLAIAQVLGEVHNNTG